MLFSKKTTPNPVGLLGQRDWKVLISFSGRGSREKLDRSLGWCPDPQGCGEGASCGAWEGPRRGAPGGAAPLEAPSPLGRPGRAALAGSPGQRSRSRIASLSPESCEAGNQVLVLPRAQIWAQAGCALHASLLGEIWDQGLPGGGWGGRVAREDDLPELFGVVGAAPARGEDPILHPFYFPPRAELSN